MIDETKCCANCEHLGYALRMGAGRGTCPDDYVYDGYVLEELVTHGSLGDGSCYTDTRFRVGCTGGNGAYQSFQLINNPKQSGTKCVIFKQGPNVLNQFDEPAPPSIRKLNKSQQRTSARYLRSIANGIEAGREILHEVRMDHDDGSPIRELYIKIERCDDGSR